MTDTTEFERCQEIPAQTNSSNKQNHPQTIICKVTKFKDKKKDLEICQMSERYENLYI